ncbi:ATP-dependent RNA helicase HrpA [Ferrimonas balearica]|uniref:ATP-dependent RNA helicase HrpA n=1 Tax=Ferrimonas balearica TaxID=44012 RepID=UPI001C994989|nr:ATP-dependent RNA helicase HrpA [Ferrimonas balearica]MBY5920754.1 ATP-dependent RNA helicase HrpA [Ferrimonas balearica]MBY5996561.1 ATP-dependent RNA helicase HrpA [Ferrimonas balearica]
MSHSNPFAPEHLALCMQADAAAIRRRLSGMKKIQDKAKKAKLTEQLTELVGQSQQRVALRAQNAPKVRYPDLPVSDKRDEIAEAIANHQVVIVAGETGSGKTTQLPKICLELGRGQRGLIGHTQPRRLAARAVASRVAEELESSLGQHVGFKVRFADQTSPDSYIKLMTDGILLAEIQHDRWLDQYDTLIIDEAHERSLNIDFILGYLKQLLPKRPDLKLIITSATIDVARFSHHFGAAPIIEVSGRTYPVEQRYLPLVQEEGPDLDLMEGIFAAVDELCDEGPGDILIFMNGEREIRDAADALNRRNLRDTEILPLYARLSHSEQARIFSPHSGRRIVLATNVAETSLTVPGIKYVIDPGTARISRYSYRTKVQRLPIEPISQASANQRAGRCGRVSEGICIRLYSQEDFESRPAFTDPEILRTNLGSVILQMLALGLGDIAAFPFIQPPDTRHIKDGMTLLEELAAITVKKGDPKMTPLGRQLARLPIDPRLARMVIEAQKQGCVHEAMVIAAALSIQDPRERPIERQQAADEKHSRFADKGSDFIAFLNLWDHIKTQQKALSGNQFRRQCKSDFLNYLRVREWQDLYSQLRQSLSDLDIRLTIGERAGEDQIHRALLAGLLSHIGMKEAEGHFKGARNTKFYVFPGSSLAKKPPKWLMAAELTETSRLFARTVAKFDPEWVEPLAGHLIKRSHSEPHWEKKPGSVVAFEQVSLYGVVVVPRRKVQYGPVNAVEAREIFIREALVGGELGLNEGFLKKNLALINEVQDLEHKSRRRDILVDEQTLFAFYDERVPEGVYTRQRFQGWWSTERRKQPELLDFEKSDLMKRDADHIGEQDYPDFWTQGDITLPLSYQFEPGAEDDGVSLHLPIALLNQMAPEGFDYLVPGLRHDLLVALIKTLPKPLRRNFVPAPNYASATLNAITPFEMPLLEALCKQLLRMTGTRVTPEDFDLSALDKHLTFNFKVEDDKGKLIAQGRDLLELKQQLKGQMKQVIATVADSGIEQRGLTDWTLGDLPKSYEQKRGAYAVKAYPALVDEGESVAVKLFDAEDKAAQANRAGLRKLLLINVPSPVKYLQQKLPNKSKLAMYFNPFGRVDLLINDCIDAGIDKILAEHKLAVANKGDFETARDVVRAELNETVVGIAEQVEKVLTSWGGIRKKLKGKISLDIAFAMSDIQAQLDRLVYKGFVADTGWDHLDDLNRYLKGVERRLEKLPVDPHRDKLHLLKVQKVEQAYQAALNKLPKGQSVPESLKAIRWLLEEYRISCFAQALGTKVPISDKRILNALNEL